MSDISEEDEPSDTNISLLPATMSLGISVSNKVENGKIFLLFSTNYSASMLCLLQKSY